MKNKTKIYTEVVVNMNTGETMSEEFYYADTKDVAQCKKAVKAVAKVVSNIGDFIVGGIAHGIGTIPHLWGGDAWWRRNAYNDDTWSFTLGETPGTNQEWALGQDVATQANSIKGDMGSYWADRKMAQSNYQNQLIANRDNMANMSDYEREVAQRNAYKGLSQGMEQAKTNQNAYVTGLQGQWEQSFTDLEGVDANYGQYASDLGFDNTSSSYLDAYRV